MMIYDATMKLISPKNVVECMLGIKFENLTIYPLIIPSTPAVLLYITTKIKFHY